MQRVVKGENFETLANGEDIFFCPIHEAYEFFKNPPKNPFVLITHNGDGNITTDPKRFDAGTSNDIDINKIDLPDNLVRWFSQNVLVEHPKIESIPIGLENSIWFPQMEKERKILEKGKEKKEIKNILYINHNIRTNPKERLRPYELFKQAPWATCIYGGNGFGFDSYLESIGNHLFTLCPEGNGTDTHRTWEVLYAGGIPIEKRNKNNRFYVDLPICFVDSWEEITGSFLFRQWELIRSRDWNLEKLWFDYWEDRVRMATKL